MDLARCYQLLEIEPGATLEEVKRSYREQVKIFHPDRFAGDPKLQLKTQEKLKNINLAFERISREFEIAAGSRARGAADPTQPNATRNTSEKDASTLGMKFVRVPGKPILMSVWPTRVQDYHAYASVVPGVNDAWRQPGFDQDSTHPVVKVSWEDARKFCRWLTGFERRAGRLSARQDCRLPTDEEWSWAVGIGPQETGASPKEKDKKLDGVFPWGSPWPPPPGAGNYGSLLGVDPYTHTSPVGSFSPNELGIYDLGGNVWEWCEDAYDETGQTRVLRGASWDGIDPITLLSSNRDHYAPTGRDDGIGFRCVCTLDGNL